MVVMALLVLVLVLVPALLLVEAHFHSLTALFSWALIHVRLQRRVGVWRAAVGGGVARAHAVRRAQPC